MLKKIQKFWMSSIMTLLVIGGLDVGLSVFGIFLANYIPAVIPIGLTIYRALIGLATITYILKHFKIIKA